MSTNRLGRVSRSQDQPRLDFERVLDVPVGDVWAMLATEEGRERGLATAKVDLRAGGSVDLDFGEGGTAGGEIVDLVPGRALEYRWRFAGEPDSTVRFELDAVDEATTKLRLEHRLLPADQAVGYGAGWHAHLEQLEAALANESPIDWMQRFTDVMPDYESQLG